MKKIFLFILTTLTVFGSCDKEKGADAIIPDPPPPAPTLEVDKTSIVAEDTPSNYNIAVTSNGTWTVVVGNEGPQWCTVNPTFGTGNKTVTLTVAGNLSQSKRHARLQFSSGALTQEVAVSQYMDYDKLELNLVVVPGSSSFKIGRYEVTQKLWGRVMGNSPDQSAERQATLKYGYGDNYPLYYVNYTDAQEFMVALNELTGKKFRLPTNTEWMYAATGGQSSRGYLYSGSNSIDDVAWYWPDMDPLRPNLPTAGLDVGTHEVGGKAPNELGLHDMTGNVWEWCSGSPDPTQFEYRGGSWFNFARECVLPAYGSHESGIRLFNVGFRLLLPQ
ncbi:hypothetical protein AGMMS49965_03820 [Bacteroidia bacterium]|nr:hypothetical protein AGMMS49965_03820 [Bacteroidia bacterium]